MKGRRDKAARQRCGPSDNIEYVGIILFLDNISNANLRWVSASKRCREHRHSPKKEMQTPIKDVPNMDAPERVGPRCKLTTMTYLFMRFEDKPDAIFTGPGTRIVVSQCPHCHRDRKGSDSVLSSLLGRMIRSSRGVTEGNEIHGLGNKYGREKVGRQRRQVE